MEVVVDQVISVQSDTRDHDDVVTDMNNSVENDAEETEGASNDGVSGSVQSYPILQKMSDLSTVIQNLKKEYMVLSDEVKGLTSDPFPYPAEVFNTLRLLSAEYESLKKKYLQESLERKRLYNEVIELKGNIRVFCRCRPLNQAENANGSASVVEIDSSQGNDLHITCADSSKKTFKFDNVFRTDDSQETVFAQTKPIVTSVMDGYNVCIFAYGQTGTGKTFTMEGTPENRGVNYKTLEELFRIKREKSGVMRYELFVSMLEVYNEKIRDLLVGNSSQQPNKLEIKQGPDGTQEVPGLIESHVHSTEEVWELLKSGTRARAVGSTSANEQSSRSHCLLRVIVKGENLINAQRTRSNLWLVDLAGSERVGRIEVEGERLKESQFINKSLSALGDVIAALASKSAHVPYRNSKLTHMLQSSLGGDCKTLMFVQISPSAADLGETLCSLNFASRVRGVESGPARKQTDFNELLKYKQMAEKLKHDEKETNKLQENVKSLQSKLTARDQICRVLQTKVRELENQLAEERRNRLRQENKAFAGTSKKQSMQKPPLDPKVRLPLRSISNITSHAGQRQIQDKENFNRHTTTTSEKDVMEPRRTSMAIRQIIQPKRRVSMATYRPEPALQLTTPLRTSDSQNRNGSGIGRAPASQIIQPRRRVSVASFRPDPNFQVTTPLRATDLTNKKVDVIGRPSFLKDPRKSRYSSLFNPSAEFSLGAEAACPSSSSKFMGSPPTQTSSWKFKHPAAVALQRKPVVWSPLKKSMSMKAVRYSSSQSQMQ